jgi:hypothetical protein
LGLIPFAVGTGLLVSRACAELTRLENAISAHERQVELLIADDRRNDFDGYDAAGIRSFAELQAHVVELRARATHPAQADPFRFAEHVHAAIADHGLTIERSQPLFEGARPRVEIVVRGSLRDTLSFLRSVRELPELWSVPFVSITPAADGRSAATVVEVGYALRSTDSR